MDLWRKMKNICVSTEALQKVKIQFTEWEKNFANHVSDNGPVPIIYKELHRSIRKLLKLTKYLNMDSLQKEAKQTYLMTHQFHSYLPLNNISSTSVYKNLYKNIFTTFTPNSQKLATT